MSRVYGPKASDHPSVGQACSACQKPFAVGDMTTLVALGPGDDPDAQERAREGRFYNAVAVVGPRCLCRSRAVASLAIVSADCVHEDWGAGHKERDVVVSWSGDRAEGWEIFAVMQRERLPVVAIRRVWRIVDGELDGPRWEIELRGDES